MLLGNKNCHHSVIIIMHHINYSIYSEKKTVGDNDITQKNYPCLLVKIYIIYQIFYVIESLVFNLTCVH